MKKIKFIVLCFVVALMPFLSSCIKNDDNNNSVNNSGFARVVQGYLGGYTLLADNGEKLIPSEESIAVLNANGVTLDGIDRAFIQYKFTNPDELNSQSSLDPDKQIYHISLNYIVSIDHPVAEVTKGAENDSIKSDPIVQLSGFTQTDYALVSNGYLTIAPVYNINKARHYFTLFHYENQEIGRSENSADPDTLNLYLSHNKNGDTGIGTPSNVVGSSYPSLYFMSFNIKNVLNNINTNKSKLIININTTENGGADDIYKKTYSVKYDLN